MQKIFDFIKSKRITISIPASVAIMAFACITISLAVTYIDPGSFKRSLVLMKDAPLLFILNTAPIAVLIILLFLLFNNAVFSCAFSGALFLIAAVANREKIILRQDPFIPGDISLFNEAFGIVKNFPAKQFLTYVLIIAFFILAIVLTFIFFETKKIKPVIRVSCIAAVVLLSFPLNTCLYANEALYNRFSVDGNIYFDVNQFTSKGFVYSFIYKFNSMKIEKPEGYNSHYFIEAENSFSPNEYKKEQLPHIIMIMGEAFSDLSENEHFDFSAYTDPLENFKRLSKSENAVSGHIAVPNFGGGTSNTEFDVLTGYSTRYLVKDGIAYSYIRGPIDAIPQRLKNIGYNTLAIHPGFSWFYNRSNVYPYMGFEDFIHLSSFQGEEKYHGGYIADKYAIDSIIDNFEKHKKNSENPFFEFCVTIQNHGPYDDKYNEVEKMFDCDIPLTSTQENLLNSYFMGIRDNDYEIGRLADYLSEIDEPVVLVFFGDHLPGFSNGMEFFDLLNYNISPNGTIEQQLNIYSTPFLIWENDAAASLTNFNNRLKNLALPKNNHISAFYLGTALLDLAGIENISPFYNFEDGLRKELPIARDDSFMLPDRTYSNSVPDTVSDELNLLKQWSYYKVFESK